MKLPPKPTKDCVPKGKEGRLYLQAIDMYEKREKAIKCMLEKLNASLRYHSVFYCPYELRKVIEEMGE